MAVRLSSPWGKFALPSAVLAVGVALSLGLGYSAEQEIERSARLRFDIAANDAAHKVENRFEDYIEVLIGLRALFDTSEHVTNAQFQHYVDGLGLRANFPGFVQLNFAKYLTAAERPAFEERLRREAARDGIGPVNFAVKPAGERAEYYPLTYIAPMAGNEAAFGKDLAAVRQGSLEALQRSRDSGAMVSSGRMIFIGGNKSDIGLAMRLPVYRTGMPQGTVEERRAAYRGSVGAGFRIAELMSDVVGKGNLNGLRVRLYDGGLGDPQTNLRGDDKPAVVPAIAEDKLLFDTGNLAKKAADATSAASAAAVSTAVAPFERALPFELGGRLWVVRVTACTGNVIGWLDRAVPWFIIGGGLAISGLLAGILYSLMTSRGRALTMAQIMTRHLRISERRLGEAQELASLGSWILDAESGTLQCSEEAQRIFGFSVDDNEPTVRALIARIPAEQREGIEAAVARAKGSTERVEFEHRLMLPDGRERWVHAIMQMTEEDGRLALRGTVRDDTQRQKGALRLKLEHDIARLLVGDGETQLVMARALAAICTQMNWDTGA